MSLYDKEAVRDSYDEVFGSLVVIESPSCDRICHGTSGIADEVSEPLLFLESPPCDRTCHGTSGIAGTQTSTNRCHGRSGIASTLDISHEMPGIAYAPASSSYSESSDEAPNLTESESELVSSDSGRSDTWRYSQGIREGNKRVRRDDVETGMVTETGPVLSYTDGFTSDGVIEYGSGSDNVSGYIPVSSTTDEGIESDNVFEHIEYGDDEVWVMGLGDRVYEFDYNGEWVFDEGERVQGGTSPTEVRVLENNVGLHGNDNATLQGNGNESYEGGMGGGARPFSLQTESGTSESNVATVTLDREGVTNGHGEENGDGQVVNAVQIDGQNCNAETEVSDGLEMAQ